MPGYTAQMVSVFFECPVHGLFETRNLIAGFGDIKVRNVGVVCPRCGLVGKGIDADYSTDALTGQSSVVLYPTPAQMRRLSNAINWARSEVARPDADPVEVKQKLRETVEREAPAVAGLIDRVLTERSGVAASWIAVAITLIDLMMGQPTTVINHTTVTNIAQQVEAAEPVVPALLPSPVQRSPRPSRAVPGLPSESSDEYARAMEDGPEAAESSFEYLGNQYRLEERESERWRVYDGDRYLGVVERADVPLTREGPMYVAHAAGEESLPDVEPTDDWQRALEYLVDQSS